MSDYDPSLLGKLKSHVVSMTLIEDAGKNGSEATPCMYYTSDRGSVTCMEMGVSQLHHNDSSFSKVSRSSKDDNFSE